MNIQEMQLVFLQDLKSGYTFEFDIPTVDIEYYLTEGQRRVFEKYYSTFENDEKSRKALSNLVIPVDLDRTNISPDQTGKYLNGEIWKLPTRLAYALKEDVTINLSRCEVTTNVESQWTTAAVKPINLDYYTKNINNPFKKPYSNLVWRVDMSNLGSKAHMLVTTDNFKVQIYHLTYLQFPIDLSIYNNVGTVLSEIVHQEIVDEAIKVALQILVNNSQFKKL